MPRISLDSERPIMAPSVCSERSEIGFGAPSDEIFTDIIGQLNSGVSSQRASVRMSTYSASPSFQSIASHGTAETGMQEIRQLTRGLDRLENKPLSLQRFVPTEQKTDNMSKLALGAKLDRALGRRMANQDAVMPSKKKKTNLMVPMNEKTALTA